MKETLIGTLLILGIMVLAWSQPGTTGLTLENQNMFPLFSALILVSMLVERGTEVLLSTLRTDNAERLDNEIAELKQKIAKQPGLTEQLTLKTRERLNYRLESGRIARWIALILGLLIATTGFRCLSYICPPPKADLLANIFVLVDVLITGAVLASGSDAINKLTRLYSSYITGTTKKLEESKP